MTNETQMPVVLTGMNALRVFAHDPISAMRYTYAAYGPFVIADFDCRCSNAGLKPQRVRSDTRLFPGNLRIVWNNELLRDGPKRRCNHEHRCTV